MRFIVSDRASGQIVREIHVTDWTHPLLNHDETQHNLHAIPDVPGRIGERIVHWGLTVVDNKLATHPALRFIMPAHPHDGFQLGLIDPAQVRAWIAAREAEKAADLARRKKPPRTNLPLRELRTMQTRED